MNGQETEALRAVLRAELQTAIAQLELRLVNRFASAAVENDVESLMRWRSFARGAIWALSGIAAIALAGAGLALKSAL